MVSLVCKSREFWREDRSGVFVLLERGGGGDGEYDWVAGKEGRSGRSGLKLSRLVRSRGHVNRDSI